ncbi:MAG: NAD+ synthase [Syntrophus sp. (in: bacteria)]|nr:NAD+ synthase [Syntrophus sp. (in: bacteria)]
MERKWRIGIGQINCTVGDLKGNCIKMMEHIERAFAMGVDVLTFPELAVTGYPPEDLLLKDRFIQDNLDALKELAAAVPDMVVVAGFVDRAGKEIYNAAAIMYKGEIKGICHKTHLPNYGVFDEKRYFTAGSQSLVFRYGRLLFGVNICEDIWHKEGPTCNQAALGAQLILNINASPYHAGKVKEREEIVRNRALYNRLFISYTNLIGGQDEIVFDGQSMVVDGDGRVIARAQAFKEDLIAVDVPEESLLKAGPGEGECIDKEKTGRVITIAQEALPRFKEPIPLWNGSFLEPVAEVYEALVLGLHDYVVKNGFAKVTIGLSGGIDSALVAALAIDALGKENVVGVSMPSRYTSNESEVDAKELADRLGITILDAPIDDLYKAYIALLEPFFAGLKGDITEENIQARIRGNILMALSNKFGWLVLTTGNKSEMSVGYATLYGDMAGGFAVIKDVPKIMVYKLSIYRNSLGSVIPERILVKAPTAELRPDQKDSDSLPPYEDLDPILKSYVEEYKHGDDIASALDTAKEIVDRVLRMVDLSEYKRRQSPPGIKITPRAFGRDRRMPITNKYRG